jgi:translation initiation factor IF-3
VRISLGIGAHDKEIKAEVAKEFLAGGDKVSIEMVLRGREKANKDFARKKFNEFVALLGEDIAIDQPIKPGPRGISTIVSKKAQKK